MQADTPLTVVFASDAHGELPLTVAAYSVLENAAPSTTFAIRVLSDGIPEDARERIRATLSRAGERHSLEFLEVGDMVSERICMLDGITTALRWPRIAWARVFLPEILPEVEKAVYLDIDTLACADLAELFATDMQGAALGVVLEHESSENLPFNERLGIPKNCPGYFNSGVLLMDLDVFRRDGLVQKVVDYANSHLDVFFCPDQDALNGALCHRLCRLHPRWNWHDGLTRRILCHNPRARLWRGSRPKEAVEAALHPGVLHYQGLKKPWRYNYRMEGARYAQTMLRAGLVDRLPLPGWNPWNGFKSLVMAPVYALTWRRVRRFARRWNVE